MKSESAPLAVDFVKPAFIVGATGHMDLDPAYRDQIKNEFQRVFKWICDRSGRSDDALGAGLALAHTPIILLSSLAPGADQWIVSAAREVDHPAGLRILAPLPFIKDQYLEASTFQREGIDEEARRFVAEFPDEDTFVVRLSDEVELDEDALRQKHRLILSSPLSKSERDRHYAAAGEYVAAYSDLLVALTDKPLGKAEDQAFVVGETVGARAIADRKRRGMTSGLLPIRSALSWADNGPVIHIYACRKAKRNSEGVLKSAQREESQLVPGVPPTERIEVLYPYDSRPIGVKKDDDSHPAWRAAGHALLKLVTDHLERLNAETIPIDFVEEAGEFARMLPGTAKDATDLPSTEPLRETLDRIARLRRRVANYSRHYQARSTQLKHLLFALAFSIAIFFSLAEYWELPNSTWPLRQVFFGVALMATVATWLAYLHFRKIIGSDERYNDYRALSEGLRVQFYWTAGGSGESVASHYLQRQRGELSWIRNTISAVAFPYEPHRMRFSQLSPDDQHAALQSIRTNWIEEQRVYFQKQIVDLAHRKRSFSTYSQVLIWTGFMLQLSFLIIPENFVLSPLASLSVFAAGALVLCALSLRPLRSRRANPLNPESVGQSLDSKSQEGREASKSEARLSKRTRPWPEKILPEQIELSLARHVLLIFLLVTAFSLLIVGSIYLLEDVTPWLPSPSKLGGLCKNVALAGGVLCGAWIGVNFFEENLRRYDSMASLFRAAGLRFDDYRTSFERVAPAQKDSAAREAIAHLQGLLVEVGCEALSENAEWLIAHRIRPLEPVSAY